MSESVSRASGGGVMLSELSGRVRSWREGREGPLLREFAEFLALPNTAEDRAGVSKNVKWLEGALRARGLRTEVWGSSGGGWVPPVVFGGLDVGAARTVGLYAHYDGQHCDADAWTVGPWTPALFDGRIEDGASRVAIPGEGERAGDDWRMYARSASDDKVSVMALLGALDAMRAAGVEPSVNLRVFVEGEEEVTSPSLPGQIGAHGDALGGCDVWVFLDGPCDSFGRRHVAFGVRGDVEVEMCVWGPVREVHSGHFGNFAMNPATELMRLLGSMKDGDGRVLIEGFEAAGSSVLSGAERAALGEVGGVDERLLEMLGMGRAEGGVVGGAGVGGGGNGGGYFERLMRPSLNVRGLRAAGVEGDARNVVPSWARASLDIRSASGTHPHALVDLLERHAAGMGFVVMDREPTLEERAAHGRLLTVTRDCGYPSWRTDLSGAAARAVVGAVEGALGSPVLRVPMLGSSMPVHAFADGLGAPVVVVPIANADSNQHSADENVRVGHLWDGMEVVAGLLRMEW